MCIYAWNLINIGPSLKFRNEVAGRLNVQLVTSATYYNKLFLYYYQCEASCFGYVYMSMQSKKLAWLVLKL